MSETNSDHTSQRIAKWLARAGVASRRGAEALIAEGKVSVNGKVLDSPALNVRGDEDIRVSGNRVSEPEPPRLWRLYKKTGFITTNSDPDGRPNIFDKLPPELPRVMSVGRLDINTEGLLLLTNDGELARQMELPATGWTRRYRVRAFGKVSQEQLDRLENGITVDGIRYGAITAKLEKQQRGNVWLNMVLREGKTREIKNVLGALDLKVNRLIRVSFGPFTLHGLEPGDVKEVPRKILRDQLGQEWQARLKPPQRAGQTGGGAGQTGGGDRGKTGKPPEPGAARQGRAGKKPVRVRNGDGKPGISKPGTSKPRAGKPGAGKPPRSKKSGQNAHHRRKG